MNTIPKLLLFFAFVLFVNTPLADTQNNNKPRVVLLADMGNEPDEEQQIVHLMLYVNQLDIQALIAVTGKFLNPESKNPYKQVLHPELFNGIIDGYAASLPNLKLHASGWPSADDLRSTIFSGQPEYGIKGIGKNKSTPGSKKIESLLLANDSRPLHIIVNAGSNTLAQSLLDLQSKLDSDTFSALLTKLRVFENGAQDDAGAWIASHYPSIHWVRSNYQTYCFAGPSWDSARGEADRTMNLGPHTWQPYPYSALGQHQWALEHIKTDHGPLGKHWPIRQMDQGQIAFLEGGGIIPWLGLTQPTLSDISQPHWGGWSGRYTQEKVKNVWSKHLSVKQSEMNQHEFWMHTEAIDAWRDPASGIFYHDIYTPVWRWRRAFFNDYQARMDWAIKPFKEANHHPLIAIAGMESKDIIKLTAQPNQTILLDASNSSDPDGDKLLFNWWIYKEAGTYTGNIALKKNNASAIKLKIPKDAANTEIHIILEVSDKNPIVSLVNYQRFVISVGQ